MSNGDLAWIANYIWGIADDVLRDLYVRGKYRDVILPMAVLRRLDAVLEGSKRAVLEMKAALDAAGVVEQDAALRSAAGQAFYNTSPFSLTELRARANRRQFSRYFYRPPPLRTLDEIRADILAAEQESEGLLAEILGPGPTGG